jgi:hypothetical protein
VLVVVVLLLLVVVCNLWGLCVLCADNSKPAYPGYDKCGPEYDKYCPKQWCCSEWGYCNTSQGKRVQGVEEHQGRGG